MRIHSGIPLLRIVPDDTKFDFMRFRRISFPISALLSIVAIFLFFHPGLNLHQRAAAEIDAEIEPRMEEQDDRHDRENRRDWKADAPEAHEIELGIVGDDPDQGYVEKAHL